jgi:hypothetical protein
MFNKSLISISKTDHRQYMHQPPLQKKLRWTNYVHKIMAMVFQDEKSILQKDFLPTGKTIKAAHYNNTLQTVREKYRTAQPWCYHPPLQCNTPHSPDSRTPVQVVRIGSVARSTIQSRPNILWFVSFWVSQSLQTNISCRLIIILLPTWSTYYMHFIQISLLRA